MKLVSDTIGRKDNPTEKHIRNAIAYSDGEGKGGDLK